MVWNVLCVRRHPQWRRPMSATRPALLDSYCKDIRHCDLVSVSAASIAISATAAGRRACRRAVPARRPRPHVEPDGEITSPSEVGLVFTPLLHPVSGLRMGRIPSFRHGLPAFTRSDLFGSSSANSAAAAKRLSEIRPESSRKCPGGRMVSGKTETSADLPCRQ